MDPRQPTHPYQITGQRLEEERRASQPKVSGRFETILVALVIIIAIFAVLGAYAALSRAEAAYQIEERV